MSQDKGGEKTTTSSTKTGSIYRGNLSFGEALALILVFLCIAFFAHCKDQSQEEIKRLQTALQVVTLTGANDGRMLKAAEAKVALLESQISRLQAEEAKVESLEWKLADLKAAAMRLFAAEEAEEEEEERRRRLILMNKCDPSMKDRLCLNQKKKQLFYAGYTLIAQTDGNVVLYNEQNRPTFATNTDNLVDDPSYMLLLRNDGLWIDGDLGHRCKVAIPSHQRPSSIIYLRLVEYRSPQVEAVFGLSDHSHLPLETTRTA